MGALGIAYFEEELASRKEEWEFIVSKARVWLARHQSAELERQAKICIQALVASAPSRPAPAPTPVKPSVQQPVQLPMPSPAPTSPAPAPKRVKKVGPKNGEINYEEF